MELCSIILSSLNPDIEKRKYRVEALEQREEYVTQKYEEVFDYKKTYFIENNENHSYIEILQNQIISKFYNLEIDHKISFEVLNNSLELLYKFYPSIYNCLEEYNIYSTDYNTLILDWEKNGDIFSLEVGVDSMGYFIEKDDNFVKQVDKISVKIYSELLKDLSDFIKG